MRSIVNVLVIVSCMLALAVIVGTYLKHSPDLDTLIALFAAWSGGILAAQLWTFTAVPEKR